MAATSSTIGLYSYFIPQPSTTIDRLHIFLHSTALLLLLYYRLAHLRLFLGQPEQENEGYIPGLAWALMTISEICFAIMWFFEQSFRWRRLIRTAHPENLPPAANDGELPGLDVFICTVDPKKEPTIDVMNTVLSAMGLEYPTEKLAVYLSDDGGCGLTLFAVKEAASFASSWLPFCRKYGIKTRSPHAYFTSLADNERLSWSDEFQQEENKIKSLYEVFKENVENGRTSGKGESVVHDRPANVEVINDNRMDCREKDDLSKLPTLVYVSREKRPSHPHRYKAGALNTLLRVSGIISKGSCILVLDCDMFCNDPTSAKQAMCFCLDPKLSPSLSFVQYPQMFYNLSKNDIYDGQGRGAYKAKWHGMDGLQGPVLSGTGYYLQRKSLYGTPKQQDECLLTPEIDREKETMPDKIADSARALATCTYEKNTKWGKEIGYSYESLLESTFTGYLLHSRGWRSVYLYPNRPAFLGCAPVDMKDAATQMVKWISGMFKIGLSSLNPITHGMSRMHPLQSLCYAYLFYHPLFTVGFLVYATIPQLCFTKGIPVYPQVSDPWFAVFAFVYASSVMAGWYGILQTGESIRTWWNEYRIWILFSLTGILFGGIDAMVKLLGLQKESFRLTNKAIDDEKLKKYEKGKFDFKGAEMLGLPLAMIAILDIICFVSGVKRLMVFMDFEDMFGQVLVSSFFIYLYFSVVAGMLTK